jgi:hypothetical protein
MAVPVIKISNDRHNFYSFDICQRLDQALCLFVMLEMHNVRFPFIFKSLESLESRRPGRSPIADFTAQTGRTPAARCRGDASDRGRHPALLPFEANIGISGTLLDPMIGL